MGLVYHKQKTVASIFCKNFKKNSRKWEAFYLFIIEENPKIAFILNF